jgi:very-short-patch-repair endonuclease
VPPHRRLPLTARTVARTVDDAIVKRLTNPRALHEMLAVLARRGRTGIANMRIVLADRPPGYRPPESHLEARTQEILRNAGLGQFERQSDVGDELGWIARVDFLDPATRLILQVDGDRWHASLSDRLHDADQDARLRRAGYRVLRITETQVFMHPDEVAAVVHAARRCRRAA